MGLTLEVHELAFGYGRTPILRGVTLPAVRSAEVTAVIGPNGSGKSTLLRCIAGFHRVQGKVAVSGGAGSGDILYLPQDPPPPSSITVFEAVMLALRIGRYSGPQRSYELQVATTLTALGLNTFATRRLADLSGGQRQLVGLAQAMARRPGVLLLDEPTSNLDLRNQLQVFRLVRDIATTQQTAVLTVVHDLALAAWVADHVVVLANGVVHSSGPPAEVITPEMLRDVYQVAGSVHRTPDGTLTVAVTDSL
ncbi:iron complex transport system ATP-binding protein [Kribbella aluminosa]|uniref:Iron complex transport system ATP-binding protein n=1 Tax=Kribbella aluminosa TaxID=416017 RepID=A0ABS4UW24_9ACTN|nr:ABC transporter ATP-binding protein [Kribbella aluminosa]MBP2355857.1 iron complex transport system ATP-binding protein [Kribbella aluminosa]